MLSGRGQSVQSHDNIEFSVSATLSQVYSKCTQAFTKYAYITALCSAIASNNQHFILSTRIVKVTLILPQIMFMGLNSLSCGNAVAIECSTVGCVIAFRFHYRAIEIMGYA